MTSRQNLACAMMTQFLRVSMPTHALKPIHWALYSFLLNLWMQSNEAEFRLLDSFVAGSLNCDERTITKAREELCEAGIIQYVLNNMGKKCKRTQYIFNETIAEQAYQFHTGQGLKPASNHVPQEVLQNLQQNLFSDTYTTNSPAQEKKGEETAPPIFTPETASDTLHPTAENTTEPCVIHTHAKPQLSDVLLEITELVKRDTGAEITDDDAALISTIAPKFIASWNAQEWTDRRKANGKPYSILPYWRDRAAGYYNACKADVRSSIVKLRTAERSQANLVANQKQREEYYAQKREQQANTPTNPPQFKQTYGTYSSQPRTGAAKPESAYGQRINLKFSDLEASMRRNPAFANTVRQYDEQFSNRATDTSASNVS